MDTQGLLDSTALQHMAEVAELRALAVMFRDKATALANYHFPMPSRTRQHAKALAWIEDIEGFSLNLTQELQGQIRDDAR